MNERNVAALAALADDLPHYSGGDLVGIANLIADYDRRFPSLGMDAPFPTPEACARAIIPLVPKLIAEDLASRGVLVPSVLTRDDWQQIVHRVAEAARYDPKDSTRDLAEAARAALAAELERIAKGDP